MLQKKQIEKLLRQVENRELRMQLNFLFSQLLNRASVEPMHNQSGTQKRKPARAALEIICRLGIEISKQEQADLLASSIEQVETETYL